MRRSVLLLPRESDRVSRSELQRVKEWIRVGQARERVLVPAREREPVPELVQEQALAQVRESSTGPGW